MRRSAPAQATGLAVAIELHRVADWRARFDVMIRQSLSRPFDEKTWNCAHFGAAAVIALCGDEHADAMLAAVGSQSYSLDLSGDDLQIQQRISSVLGPAMQNRALARLGDIAVGYIGRRRRQPLGIGVIVGPRAAFVSLQGLRYYPRQVIGQAWGVG